MTAYGPVHWSRSLTVAVDVVVAIWLAAMLVVGGLIKVEIDQLAATADSISEISAQESAVASALTPLRGIPFADAQVAAAQQELLDGSARTQHDAAVTRTSVHALSGSAFALVVLLAMFPVVAFYVPMRLTRYARRPAARRKRPVAA